MSDGRSQLEGVRSKLRQQSMNAVARARLAAMTTTRAVFSYDELAALGPYDLVVFDEASQVGLAHALALVPLGNAVIFAGDPRQLAPIVVSKGADAHEWLGRSAFYAMREDGPLHLSVGRAVEDGARNLPHGQQHLLRWQIESGLDLQLRSILAR